MAEHNQHNTLTPAQTLFMGYLFEQTGDTFYLTDLCLESGFSKASISRMLKNLRQQGYLEMPHSLKDDRKKEIILTDKALAEKESIQNYLSELQDCLCSGISEKNLSIFEECLRIMIDNLGSKCRKEQTNVKNFNETIERI